MKRRNIFGTISLIIIGIVFGAILVTSADLVKTSKAETIQVGTSSSPVGDVSMQDFNNAFIQVAEKVTPSIVSITVVSESKDDPHDGFDFNFPFKFKDNFPKERQGGGSGVIISEDGYILTNNHVVKDAIHVKVSLFDKREFDAEIVGTDPLTDLAVIKVDAEDLPAAYLGDSDKLKVGSWVMAIGNPLSYLTSTVTAGIVSALGRNINIIRDTYGVEDFIQTDAAINPGNSGGALVDLTGAVIGINSAIATNGFSSSYIGYGFAIPINLAKSVAKDLIENGNVNRGYIGVSIGEVDAAAAKALGLEKAKGVLIQGVVKGGAAENEDIEAGDVILKIDGKEVDKPNQIQAYIATKRAGDEVELSLYRDGDIVKRRVILKGRDENSTTNKFAKKEKTKKKKNESELYEADFTELGLKVKDLSPNIMKKYDIENGVLITEVKRFSKAANQRLTEGAIIVEVDKKPVESAEEFEKIIDSKKGDAVLLKVLISKDTTVFVGLEIPE